MVMDMNASAVQTLEQLRSFLAGSVDVALDCPGDASCYRFIADVLALQLPPTGTSTHQGTPRTRLHRASSSSTISTRAKPGITRDLSHTANQISDKALRAGYQNTDRYTHIYPLFDMHDLAKSTSAHSSLLAGSS